MKSSEILAAAKRLIDAPEKLCRGKYKEVDEKGNIIGYCSVGAVNEIARGARFNDEYLRVIKAKEYLAVLTGNNTAHFNDTRPHNQIMEVFDKAIADAQANGD